jgi:transcriptional regulator with XRE-family HTH domain
MPKPIDIHVGKRLRLRRTVLGVSQEKLAEILGITFQQVQKYEKGVNRIGSSRLFDIAKALNVPVGFFFDEYTEEVVGGVAIAAEDEAEFEHEGNAKNRETMALVKAYYQISDPKIRKKALQLIKSLADAS